MEGCFLSVVLKDPAQSSYALVYLRENGKPNCLNFFLSSSSLLWFSLVFAKMPFRFAGTSKTNEPDQSDPQQPKFDPTQPILLHPTPLRSEPYIPPTMDLSETSDFDAEEQMQQVMIVLPTQSAIEEKNKILETNESTIILTGAAAALAQGGPTVGSVDIGENEDSYLFRVSIPGALKEDSEI
ncbi:alpha-crystallin domain-containing protein 22.3 isoform X3 [Pyrus x bretschneideri]|uniref:alpha-crystallin domain-containing protein 22.3 isoform X3 n=1 Tax=Pyrus x bretschneideri TaxID=225117 RepID=UPI00202F10A0|nr:alpha-crystallin domain-containing protein 22.3 isoform X3 [Pyrus x bretschneideri]